MTTDQEPARSETAAIGPIKAGSASFPDTALLVMLGNLAKRLGRSIGSDSTNRWMRGLLGVAAGITIVAWPDEWLSSTVFLFGIYGLLDGLLLLVTMVIHRDHLGKRAARSLTSLAVGAFALTEPDIGRTAMLGVLAIWVIVMSALRLNAALDFAQDKVRARWVPATLALLAIVGASMVLAQPDGSTLSVSLNVGAFALINGATLIVLEVRAARAKSR
jgi:uncharacterized membrane protein HdeD (DUF308 family)